MFTLKALALVPALIVAASTKTEVGTFSEPTQGETLSLGQSYTARWSVKSDISLGPDATGKLCLIPSIGDKTCDGENFIQDDVGFYAREATFTVPDGATKGKSYLTLKKTKGDDELSIESEQISVG